MIDDSHPRNSVPPVRVAVIGAGAFGAHHAKVYAAEPGCHLVAIVDRDLDRAQAVADDVGARHFYATHQELLTAHPLDAVSVVTGSGFHLQPTTDALDSGACVLLEKPVVMTSAEGARLRAASASSAGFVMPAHILRFAEPYRELRRRLDAGDIGTPRALSFRRHRGVDHDAHFPGVHPVLMTMIHDIDLALWLTGDTPAGVTARQFDAPGRHQPLAVWAEVETKAGTLLSFQVSWSLTSVPMPDALEIIGDDGALTLSVDPRVWDLSAATPDTSGAPHIGHAALTAEIRTFLDGVRLGRAPEDVMLDDALAGISLAESIITHARASRNGVDA